ncbi:MAG: cell division protein ZapA [Gammaproteobacteria bacterium]|jgi:cell division protein ZapA|nr:cell division protein ZapA [Gammaproteobacteria bacterium]MBT5052788.1 cell division protein ZapA [Gammaproteobacteria bacterium]
MATSETITVSIFDKDYQVSCPADEVQALRDSAFYLDQKMREIKKSGSVLGLDRLAVMAALNITNDFLSVDREHQNSRQSLVDSDDVLKHSEQRVDALIQTLKASNL